MVKFLLTLLVLVLSSQANAALPASAGYKAVPVQGGAATYGSTPEAACAPHANLYQPENGWGGGQSLLSGNGYEGYCRRGGYDFYRSYIYVMQAEFSRANICPANSSLQGGSCVCTNGHIEQNGQCVFDDPQEKKCKAMKGTEAAFTAGSKKYPSDLNFCVGGTVAGCQASFTKALGKETNGAMAYTWFGVYSGAKCGATDNDVTPSECKGTWGQINGVNVCLSAGTDPAATTSTKTTESGSKTTTSAPAPGASAPAGGASAPSSGSSDDGTTSTEKETTCTGTKCQTTTTTTKTNPDGSSTTEQTSKDQPKDDYCKDNPKSYQCKEYNLGDVEAQAVTNKEVQLGITKSTTSFGPETGSCPAPKTVQVMGINLSMPFTLLCQFAIQIKPLLIGFAWLSSILTFFGFARK